MRVIGSTGWHVASNDTVHYLSIAPIFALISALVVR
jgi:hypothetical protein